MLIRFLVALLVITGLLGIVLGLLVLSMLIGGEEYGVVIYVMLAVVISAAIFAVTGNAG